MATVVIPVGGGSSTPTLDPTALMTSDQHLARARELMRKAEVLVKANCGLDWVWQYGPLITAHVDLAQEIDRQKAK